MNLLKTGKLIARLRKEKGLTQKQVAQNLSICSKTVSKWETGRGFPDVSFIPTLSKILGVDISKLIVGEMPEAKSDGGNIRKTGFYVCEKCNNIITSIGNAEILCCGRTLSSLLPKTPDDKHKINAEIIEDDFYITFTHPMEKEHYISFFSYVRFDRILTVKLYPEQSGELRFPRMRGGKLLYYCNKHGLFELRI